MVSYGLGAGRLAIKLGVDINSAKNTLDLFWRKFKKIKELLDTYVSDGIKARCAVSLLDNRRRDLSNINFFVPKQRAHAMSLLKNHNFQSGNASVTKRALCNIQAGFFEYKEWKGKLLNVIHDEVISTHISKYDDEVYKFVKDAMVAAGEYYIKSIPVVVDAVLDKHWVH